MAAAAEGADDLTMEVTGDIPVQVVLDQLEKSPLLKKLKVTEWKYRNDHCDDILTAVARSCPELEELVLIDCHVTRDPMKALARSCTKLVSCELRDLDFTPSNQHLLTIFSRCSQLQKFVMSEIFYHRHRHSSTDRVWHYQNLKELIVDSLPTKWQVLMLTRIGPQLERLEMDQIKGDAWLLLGKCHQLKVLKIEDAFGLTGKGFQNGIGTLTNLRQLIIPGVGWLFETEALHTFLSRQSVMGQLEELNVRGIRINEACLEAILENCCVLQALTFTYNDSAMSPGCLNNFITTRAPAALQKLDVWYSEGKLTQDFIASCTKEGLQVIFHEIPIFRLDMLDSSDEDIWFGRGSDSDDSPW